MSKSLVQNPDYTYLKTKRMGKKIAIVAKTIKGTCPPDRDAIRLQGIDLMMQRLYGGKTNKEMEAETGLSQPVVSNRLKAAKELGVPEVAREIFIKEFLPASMAVLQEALHSSNLKIATQVALQVVKGLEIMEDPAAKPEAFGEPESLEVWRAKFVKKAPVVEGVVVRQLTEGEEENEPKE